MGLTSVLFKKKHSFSRLGEKLNVKREPLVEYGEHAHRNVSGRL